MSVTIKNVAKLAEVSPSSVSRFINQPDCLSAKKAFRIKQAIETLDYTPNPVARSLKVGNSNLIGVIVPSINSYFSPMCRAISDFFYQQGYPVFFCESGENGEKESYYLQEMLDLRFAGILLSAITSTPEQLINISKTTHLTLVDRIVNAPVDMVFIDNERLGQDITEFMLKKGHNHILGLFGSGKSRHSMQRLAGAQKAAAAFCGATLDVQMDCYDVDMTFESIERALAASNPPTALISYGLTVTENCLNAFSNLKVSIPQDIDFACWALKDFESKYRYRVPTIKEDPYEMGITACDLLLKRMKQNNKKTKTHIFSVSFEAPPPPSPEN